MTDTNDSYPKTNLRKVNGYAVYGTVEMAETYPTDKYGDYVDFAIKLDAPGTFIDKDGAEFTSDRIRIGEKATGAGPNSGALNQLKRLNYTIDTVRGAYLKFSVKPENEKDKNPTKFFFNIDPVPGRTTAPSALPDPELARKRADAQAAYAAALEYVLTVVVPKMDKAASNMDLSAVGAADVNAIVQTLLNQENR